MKKFLSQLYTVSRFANLYSTKIELEGLGIYFDYSWNLEISVNSRNVAKVISGTLYRLDGVSLTEKRKVKKLFSKYKEDILDKVIEKVGKSFDKEKQELSDMRKERDEWKDKAQTPLETNS